MFLSFFYLLRQRGLDISPNEWMTLLDGIEKGLHCSSLIGFYQLCRAVLLKSEIEFDRFDQAFTEFFKDVPFNGELPKEFLSWLNTPADDLRRSIEELRAEGGFTDKHMEDLLRGGRVCIFKRPPFSQVSWIVASMSNSRSELSI